MGGKLSGPGGFFADADFDFEARIVLGAAASGLGDVGLVLATTDRIADGDPQSWFDAWTGVAADLAGRGEQALGHGHLATASWAFLAAAEYYIKALVFPSARSFSSGPLAQEPPASAPPREASARWKSPWWRL